MLFLDTVGCVKDHLRVLTFHFLLFRCLGSFICLLSTFLPLSETTSLGC